jgi:hypothetical protein
MLRHLQTAPATTVAESASKTEPKTTAPPFTAEEIAHAIATLEKERSTTDTVSNNATQIVAVLEQLHLDLTPDEVTARIESERLMRVQKHRQLRRRFHIIYGVLAATSCIFFAYALWVIRQNSRVEIAAPTVAEQTAQAVTPATKMPSLSEILITDTVGGKAMQRTLAEVPEGKVVTITGGQLERFLDFKSPSHDTFDDTFRWKIFRKGELWYLKAFTDIELSPGALAATDHMLLQNIKSKPGALHAPVQIVVPVNDVLVTGVDSMPMSPEHMLYVQLKNTNRLRYE